MKSPLVCFAGLIVIGSAVMLRSFQADGRNGETVTASYSRGVLRVAIPYRAPHSGGGRLTIEVLDPEDHPVGSSDRRVDVSIGKGEWRDDLRLASALETKELVWHRLRYRFVYSEVKNSTIEGTESISEILRTPAVHILGQRSYLSGGSAAVRVIVTDSKNEPIAGASSVEIELAIADRSRTLFQGPLNPRGTAEAQFRIPAGLEGTYPLRYIVDTPIGSTEFTQQVQLQNKASILLTAEKPIYQPGQEIHVRALALDRANHEATAGRKLTFELEDSRGNKVAKSVTQTDKFGVASAKFGLADEVNLGTYHLRALMGDGNKAEIALNVEKYVLPKFKVAIDFAEKTKHGYRPGDHVTGTVHANYFFGKAVNDGEISVKGTGIDVTTFEVGSVQGKTDGQGDYHFDLTLPKYFAGRRGATHVLVEATVKDATGHAETRGQPITVSESPLIITAIPEGGTLIRHLENQVFILTSYPDGQPAQADITVRGQSAKTDAGGVAMIRLGAGTGAEDLKIEATDKEGNHTSSSVQLKSREGSDQVLLRTEKAVYRAGDRIELKILSTKEQGTAYVDVVKEGQTVLTRDLDIRNGQAELSVMATPELAGTLDFNAYVFGRDARAASDHRLVFVQPADELKIEATTDSAVYKPGDEARVRFRVTNTKGQGVQAALGLQVVDEAVFALAEKQPGFAKVFFYLEQEAMKPRYEIHSIGMPEAVGTAQHDLAARALFAATEMVSTNRFETEVGREIPQDRRWTYASRYQCRFNAQVARVAERLTQNYAARGSASDLSEVMADISVPEVFDSWDTKLRVERVPWDPQKRYYMLRSAGPDKRFGTVDDLSAYLEVRTGKTVNPPLPNQSDVDVNIEHDRGAVNGLAEIAGSVKDQTGAAVPRASVKLTKASGEVRNERSDEWGRFSFSAIPAGDYRVEVLSPGFRMATAQFSVKARDRAVLSTVLAVGAVTQTVVVKAANMRSGTGHGFGGGMAGGVIGGIIGGVPQRIEQYAKIFAPPKITYKSKDALESGSAHVRSYFPEALYINPEIITDASGAASIVIPIADSITTWRMAMFASTVHGALGSGTSNLKVFQDFFADLDLPVTLTQGDRVSIPVAVYNYTGAPGDVSLKLKQDQWFSLVEDSAEKALPVEAGKVGGSEFTIEAKRIGKFKLTLSANMKGRADIVVREIEVIPNGREQTMVFNGRLEQTVQREVNFPAGSIAEANTVLVRLYPGPLSQVIEGMDSILRMPGGCFEQTSSSTYPNVLGLDYMKRTKKSTPEIHAKAEGYIANGYQRLLTFEVPGGGFSWFGQAPANKILTAYGLMEFSDMSKVYEVDPKAIQRTQQWLASQQQPDGSWKPDTNFINEGATNRYNTDVLRITAYIAWSLKNTGYQGQAVEKARYFIDKAPATDAYTLAVIANFAAEYAKDRPFTNQAVARLLDARTEKDEQVWWNAEETSVYGRGASAAIETTGLAVQALLKSGEASATAQKALTYIASKKDATGAWGTTQATIMALRALLLATEKGSADVRGTVEITLNGKPVQKLVLTPENNDLLHQFVFKNVDSSANTVGVRFDGQGGLAYQVAGRYFVPWTTKPANEALSINVNYDRTRLAQDDVATATALVKNNLTKTANMVMVDLGIPPGFDLLSEDLQTYKEKSAGAISGKLEKFSQTATQAILYFDSIGAGDTVTLPFRLRAKYPIRARTFQSRVYEYYDPEVSSVAQPVQLEVRQR
jgi:uncharacterized protein YfaS (alpha-2-macroglobulin family)